ncbi:MAG: tetratricopeptide repeat protein, partial [Methanomethylophilus sp.]
MLSPKNTRHKSASEMIRQADLYRIGADGEQNFTQAFLLYKRAASRGNTHAMFLLGTMYESGHGTRQSYRDAAKWYERG